MKKLKNTKNPIKYSFILIIFFSLCIFSTHKVYASSVSFEMPTDVKVGESLDVIVGADTGGILVNSVELVIAYDPSLASFTGYSDDNGVVKLWIDPPHASEGKIYLSGVIPGGVTSLYNPQKNGSTDLPLVHLFFTARAVGDTQFSFVDSQVLQGDGAGTPLSHTRLSRDVEIKNNPNFSYTADQKNIQAENVNENTKSLRQKFNYDFLIISLLILIGIAVYKLLKYKDAK